MKHRSHRRHRSVVKHVKFARPTWNHCEICMGKYFALMRNSKSQWFLLNWLDFSQRIWWNNGNCILHKKIYIWMINSWIWLSMFSSSNSRHNDLLAEVNSNWKEATQSYERWQTIFILLTFMLHLIHCTLYMKKSYRCIIQHLSKEESQSNRFVMIWGWVNDDRIKKIWMIKGNLFAIVNWKKA